MTKQLVSVRGVIWPRVEAQLQKIPGMGPAHIRTVARLVTRMSGLPDWTSKHKAVDGDDWVWVEAGVIATLDTGEILECKGGWFKPVPTASGKAVAD